jgi:predicted O-methyltransferase YrrM
MSRYQGVSSGLPAVDDYLTDGYSEVKGMSGRFSAAICGGLMRIQSELGIFGHAAEIGTFHGRFFIALAHALRPGERALGMDLFDWPSPEVEQSFERNCDRYGIGRETRITWKANSQSTEPRDLLSKLSGGSVRFFHIDGEHSRAALTQDLELATAVLAPGGLIALDDMLHPGYPTLVAAVLDYLARHPEMTVLCIIDRETVVAATKFVLCRKDWFKRYEERLMEDYKDNIWPMGADFEPHWCLMLSLDTALPKLD